MQPWFKIKGVYNEMKSICKVLRTATKQCNQNSIAMSFISIDKKICAANLNQLDPTFMYTQLLKQILLDIKPTEHTIKDFAASARKQYVSNPRKRDDINEFERKYSSQTSIYWYTRENFIYKILNRALRLLEADLILDMGFLLHDIHCEVSQPYEK